MLCKISSQMNSEKLSSIFSLFITLRSRRVRNWFEGTLGLASGPNFPVSLSNHFGFTHWWLYSSPQHSQGGLIQLKTGGAYDAWLQGLCETWYLHHDISRWKKEKGILSKIFQEPLYMDNTRTNPVSPKMHWRYQNSTQQTFSQLRNFEIRPELHKIRPFPDLEALELWKGWSGN